MNMRDDMGIPPRTEEQHGPCGDGDIGSHGGPDDRHCIVCIDKSCPYNQPDAPFVFQVAVHSVTSGSPNGRDDGYPMIHRLPTLYATTAVAQQEADLLNQPNWRGRAPQKDQLGWHFVVTVPVLNQAEYDKVLIERAQQEADRAQQAADRERQRAQAAIDAANAAAQRVADLKGQP